MTRSTIYQAARYLTSGGIGITVNLLTYHLLIRLGIPYLAGSVCAVSLSTIVGFLLQKFWTFQNRAPGAVRRQFLLYVGIALGNIGLNTAVVFLLVSRFDSPPLFAQAAAAALVAVTSFTLYRTYVFSVTHSPEPGSTGAI